ncbi:hypothetical protein ACRALDRAFT_207833 [Sodiomyces alcalophilus JCM 7366]|uniref:uncharacterized protein n=1 Tax=Sodiomyces alcalophilus JCM 7366 TaxID=591952 RepID=UPI0039B3675B
MAQASLPGRRFFHSTQQSLLVSNDYFGRSIQSLSSPPVCAGGFVEPLAAVQTADPAFPPPGPPPPVSNALSLLWAVGRSGFSVGAGRGKKSGVKKGEDDESDEDCATGLYQWQNEIHPMLLDLVLVSQVLAGYYAGVRLGTGTGNWSIYNVKTYDPWNPIRIRSQEPRSGGRLSIHSAPRHCNPIISFSEGQNQNHQRAVPFKRPRVSYSETYLAGRKGGPMRGGKERASYRVVLLSSHSTTREPRQGGLATQLASVLRKGAIYRRAAQDQGEGSAPLPLCSGKMGLAGILMHCIPFLSLLMFRPVPGKLPFLQNAPCLPRRGQVLSIMIIEESCEPSRDCRALGLLLRLSNKPESPWETGALDCILVEIMGQLEGLEARVPSRGPAPPRKASGAVSAMIWTVYDREERKELFNSKYRRDSKPTVRIGATSRQTLLGVFLRPWLAAIDTFLIPKTPSGTEGARSIIGLIHSRARDAGIPLASDQETYSSTAAVFFTNENPTNAFRNWMHKSSLCRPFRRFAAMKLGEDEGQDTRRRETRHIGLHFTNAPNPVSPPRVDLPSLSCVCHGFRSLMHRSIERALVVPPSRLLHTAEGGPSRSGFAIEAVTTPNFCNGSPAVLYPTNADDPNVTSLCSTRPAKYRHTNETHQHEACTRHKPFQIPIWTPAHVMQPVLTGQTRCIRGSPLFDPSPAIPFSLVPVNTTTSCLPTPHLCPSSAV